MRLGKTLPTRSHTYLLFTIVRIRLLMKYFMYVHWKMNNQAILSFLIRIFCDLVLVPFSIRKFVLFMLKLHSCTCYFFLLFFVHFILKPQFPLAINDFMTTYFLNPNKSSGTCNRQAYLQHHIPLLNTRLVCWNHLKDWRSTMSMYFVQRAESWW